MIVFMVKIEGFRMFNATSLLFCKMVVIFVLVGSIFGCDFFEDNVISDMSDAYVSVDFESDNDEVMEKSIKNEAVTSVVNHYFPVGSSMDAAVKYLEERDFSVYQYSDRGIKSFKKGTEIPYSDYAHKKSVIGDMRGESVYIASYVKSYGPAIFLGFEGKEFRIIFDVGEDGRILSVNGMLYFHGL